MSSESSRESNVEDWDRVLAIAKDCDLHSLQMDAAEGFLLSRVDGRTSWRVLREMGAMASEEVDLCLESWLARGIVAIDAARSLAERDRRRADAERQGKARREAVKQVGQLPSSVDESALDPSLEIDVGVQRRILEFEVALRQPYHLLLGVPEAADPKQVKHAYFALSKEFHPDRFFRKRIGAYAERLDRIFKKVTEAYELLSDPTTRAELERSMQAARAEAAAPETGAVPNNAQPSASAAGRASEPARPISKLERLRQRMPYKIPERMLAERGRQAEHFIVEARRSAQRGAFGEALAAIRLALAFNPFDEAARAAFGEYQARAAELRAQKLLADTAQLEPAQLKEAMRLIEDVLLYRPHDPAVNERAARVAVELGQLERAAEYAERAVEHSPDVFLYRLTLGRVRAASGDPNAARREIEQALALDPHNDEARQLLLSLRTSGVTKASGAGAAAPGRGRR